MSTITAIEPQQKNPRRVNIHLDGAFAFGVAAVVAAWLKVGQQLSPERITSLQAEDALETTYQKALHFLSYRPRSSEEVHQNLSKRGCDPALVEAIIDRLQKNGLVDDEAFARAWVDNRTTFRPRGRTALRVELRRKGLNDEIIQSVLDEAPDETQLALQAARKQANRYAGLQEQVFRQKLSGFLARRGFSYSTLAPVVSKVWQECQMADTGRKIEDEDEIQ